MFFLRNTITIPCPGGTIATLCTKNFMQEMKFRNIQNVVVMGGTNNLFDKSSKPLMSPVVVSDGIYYLIRASKFNRFNVGIMELISRRGKTQGSAVNECYKGITSELKVTYFSHRRFRTNMTEDGLHLNPSQIGELAAHFKTVFQRFDRSFVFFECNQVQLRI